MQLINNVLGRKAEEYTRNGNKLHNFDEAARRKNTLPALTLEGMFDKHYQNYQDMLADMQQPFANAPTEAQIRERFGDIINYFILQEVIFLRHYGYINGNNQEPERDREIPYESSQLKEALKNIHSKFTGEPKH